MQRNALLLTLTTTLASLMACSEVPEARPFDFWSSSGEAGDSSGADESETSDGMASGADEGELESGELESGEFESGAGDSGGAEGDDGDGDGACVPVSETVSLVQSPADIIVIVDNSDGMTEEAIFVQAQLNGFAAQLEMSGVDYHVVLISSYPDNGNGVCINPPLGSGSCPNYDDNLPRYHHVDEKISSHNALAKLIATQMQWKDSIRPDSVKHIVVVSNDESELGPHPFENMFKGLDSSYDPFVFHAIVCPWNCPESADIGQVYLDLVNKTGGVLGDLCEQDFQAAFDDLANAVIQDAQLSCQFDIPPPPMGMSLDPDMVNVEIDDGNNNLEDVPRVADLAECMNHPEGWYYDDPGNPVQIFLCPQTCAKAQGYTMGSIKVKFGCETLSPQ